MCASGSGADHAARRASDPPRPDPRPGRPMPERTGGCGRSRTPSRSTSSSCATGALTGAARRTARAARRSGSRSRRRPPAAATAAPNSRESSGWATCAPASSASSSRLPSPSSAQRRPRSFRMRVGALSGSDASSAAHARMSSRRAGAVSHGNRSSGKRRASAARRSGRGLASSAIRIRSRGRGDSLRSSTDAARAQRELPKSSSPPMPVRSVPPSAASSSGTWKWALNGHRSP